MIDSIGLSKNQKKISKPKMAWWALLMQLSRWEFTPPAVTTLLPKISTVHSCATITSADPTRLGIFTVLRTTKPRIIFYQILLFCHSFNQVFNQGLFIRSISKIQNPGFSVTQLVTNLYLTKATPSLFEKERQLMYVLLYCICFKGTRPIIIYNS